MALLLKRAPRFPPREPRAAVDVYSLLLLPDDRVVTVAIRNISAWGFMASGPVDLQPDTWLGVTIPGCGIVRAQIRWSEAGAFGAQFERAIDVERL